MKALLIPLCASLLVAGCMPLPPGTHIFVSDDGCTSDGFCRPSEGGSACNSYYAPTREVVVLQGQPCKVLMHEFCHAHQHQTILSETGREPSDLTLHDWDGTTEAAAYASVVAEHPRPDDWLISDDTLLEDFAEACGRYMARDPRYPGEPNRDQFFSDRNFR